MLNFGNFLFFPARYRDRNTIIGENRVQKVTYDFDVFEGTNGKLTFSAILNEKYQTSVAIYGNAFTIATPCKVSCTCQSFMYEFAYAIDAQQSLMESYRLGVRRPSKKNTENIPCGCKHIVTLCQYLWSHRDIYQRALTMELAKALGGKVK